MNKHSISLRHRGCLLTLAVLCLGLFGCSKPAKKPLPPAPAAADIRLPELFIPEPVLPKPTGLKRSELPPVGSYLLPERVVEVQPHDMPLDNPSTVRYDLEASLEEVMEFYRKRGYRVVRNPKGASVFPRSGGGILQVLRGKGRKLRLLAITESTAQTPVQDLPNTEIPH